MTKEKAINIAKEIDGEEFVDCQELVIDIYNHVEDFIFSKLSIENKMLKERNKSTIEDFKVQKGKTYMLGIATGIMIAAIIVQIIQKV